MAKGGCGRHLPSETEADSLDPEAHLADPKAHPSPDPEAAEAGGTHPGGMHSWLLCDVTFRLL